jgi:hypothetical protein
MCITGVIVEDSIALLVGFAFFAAMPWPNETLGMMVTTGVVIPLLVLGIGHLVFGMRTR